MYLYSIDYTLKLTFITYSNNNCITIILGDILWDSMLGYLDYLQLSYNDILYIFFVFLLPISI